jgi:hypothetical protein
MDIPSQAAPVPRRYMQAIISRHNRNYWYPWEAVLRDLQAGSATASVPAGGQRPKRDRQKAEPPPAPPATPGDFTTEQSVFAVRPARRG